MEGTWVGIAAMAVTGFFAWMNARDRLRYDRELDALRSQNATQAAQITGLSASYDRCQADHEAAKKELAACHEKHAAHDSQISDLRSALADLKKNL